MSRQQCSFAGIGGPLPLLFEVIALLAEVRALRPNVPLGCEDLRAGRAVT